MGKTNKVYQQILTGRSDRNVSFNDLKRLLTNLGFTERIKGSHFIYTKEAVVEIINIQEKSGLAKPYQVRQVRQLLVKYQMEPENE